MRRWLAPHTLLPRPHPSLQVQTPYVRLGRLPYPDHCAQRSAGPPHPSLRRSKLQECLRTGLRASAHLQRRFRSLPRQEGLPPCWRARWSACARVPAAWPHSAPAAAVHASRVRLEQGRMRGGTHMLTGVWRRSGVGAQSTARCLSSARSGASTRATCIIRHLYAARGMHGARCQHMLASSPCPCGSCLYISTSAGSHLRTQLMDVPART